MPFNVSYTDAALTISLEGDVGIADAREFHASLADWISVAEKIEVDATNADSMDTSICQILYALKQTRIPFSLHQPSEGFQRSLRRRGLADAF